jgi:hypothetical protein
MASFALSRQTEWVSPSGESILLDGVFKVRESCVSVLWEENVFDPQFLPRQGDTAESLAKSIQPYDMFDDIYVTLSSKKEQLNGTTYPQPRRITLGMVHSQGYKIDDVPVVKLFHYPVKCSISKEMCIPVPTYIYRFVKMVWERIRDLLPSPAREFPPNHCQQCFNYSDFKLCLGKHQDNKVLGNGK